jgi:histidyl-tRNA synthetase
MGVGDEASLFHVIDKLDKIGLEGVKEELSTCGLPAGPCERVLMAMDQKGNCREVLAHAMILLKDVPIAREGLSELGELLDYTEALGVPQERLEIDLHLTRGLDYYTGPIYEVNLKSLDNFGSLGGGGRYDDLMSLYGGTSLPATGVSIGLSRVLAALLKLELLKPRQSPSNVLVMRLPDSPLDSAMRLCASLRTEGVAAEVYYDADRLKKQFQLAERKGIPVAAILGSTEIAEGTVNLKLLATGEQLTVRQESAAQQIRAWLA